MYNGGLKDVSVRCEKKLFYLSTTNKFIRLIKMPMTCNLVIKQITKIMLQSVKITI